MLLSVFILVSTLIPVVHVNDFAELLRPETVSQLETILTTFENETGNEIAVVTIDTHGPDETIETYAEKLFQQWGIGKKKEDNGLLLLIARDDREMRIEVGYGLEQSVTDIESGRIIREVLAPAFQANQYDEGIIAAIERIMGDIGGEGTPIKQHGLTNEEIFYLILIIIIIIINIRRMRKGGKGLFLPIFINRGGGSSGGFGGGSSGGGGASGRW